MSISVKATTHEGKPDNIFLQAFPDLCPFCKKHGNPDFQSAVCHYSKHTAHAAFRCPVQDCRALYIGVYAIISSGGQHGTQCKLQTTVTAAIVARKTFAEPVEHLSSMFTTTYNQALIAEHNGLDQICGPGYRKALEFLIKDFLIAHIYKSSPEKHEEIRKLFLSRAIEEHIAEPRIKQFAQRAVWIGNDETHYTRKWSGKDVSDLKALIRITVDYIDLTIESDRYLSEMPEPKKSCD